MMTRRSPGLLTALTLTGIGLIAAPAARAQTVQYGSQASFDAATTGLTTFTFDGSTTAGNVTLYSSGLTVDGTTFTGSPNILYVVDPTAGYGDPFGGHQYLAGDQNQAVNVALPSGITAFGADFSNYASNSGATVTAIVNGQSFTFGEPNEGSSVFAGFTTTTPITSLSFTNSDLGTALDNVSFGTFTPAVTTTPEPASYAVFAMGGFGLLGLSLKARKRIA